MSGHNKWSTIKHKKGAADAKRGKLFSRLIKELTVAARFGGGDVSGNPRLRTAVATAKAANMPKDNIERAIKKGAGELGGAAYEEFSYEGYTPGGAAVLVEILTDNKNRAASDVRHVFSKHGGNLGETGCVAWMFSKKGLISFDAEKAGEDEIMEVALEAGAEDVDSEGSEIDVTTAPEDFEAVKSAFDEKGLEYLAAEISMVPQNSVELDAKTAPRTIKLMDALDDLDDVQKVWSNFEIPEEVMKDL
ncbi:MAG: YebC/PmpR family DNA-binding transcriptional regulator [Thermodesulfobacteriota bacterium]|nr:YebC/PmpR family DNA-binding transcriptional regulator [Thermodesulfobacteriota bacterium]